MVPSPTPRPAVLLFIATQLLSHLTHTLAANPIDLRREILGSATSFWKRGAAYTDPANGGGSMLTIVNGTYPAGLGEPLNIILSAESDKDVLVKSPDEGGFLNYMLSANLGEECLGQHLGPDQMANLGDGMGNVSEVEELRWNFGDPYIGTCRETFDGGLHLRYWIQNNTGAYFIAASVEKDLNSGHDIVVNGYNLGRDDMVGNLTGTTRDSRTVTNQSTFSGTTSYNNYTYQTDVKYASGLLQNSSADINHYITVQAENDSAIDGLVAILTVKITERPKSGAFRTVSEISAIALLPSLLIGCIMTI